MGDENKVIVVNGIKYDGDPEEVIRGLVKQIEELKEHRQSYYCVIPWKLLTDKSIPSTAKLLYGEISALANREGFCWASNEHFGEVFGVEPKTTISKLVNTLKVANYIYVEIDKGGGNRRKIYLQPPVIKKDDRDYGKSRQGITKNHDIDNNILDNNKEIILPKKKSSLIDSITEVDLQEIAEKYKVSVGFVELQLEKMKNWCQAKGKTYKDYKHALRNWVLMDMQRHVERRQDDKYRPIDARHIK